MRQETRMLLAMALSAAVLFLYYSYFAPLPANKPVAPQQAVTQTAPAPAAALTPAAPAAVDPQETRAEAKDISIRTAKADAVLSTKGGVLTQYALKDYHVTADKDSPHRDLLAQMPGSTALFLGLEGYDKLTPETVFELVRDEAMADGGRLVVLGWQDANLRLEKKFLFGGPKTSYGVLLTYTVTNRASVPLQVKPYLQHRIHQKPVKNKGGFFSFLQPPDDLFALTYLQNNSLHHDMRWDKFSEPVAVSGGASWGGITDRYFLLALIPEQAQSAAATLTFAREGDFLSGRVANAPLILAPATAADGHFSAFLGPKLLDELRKMDVNLDRVVDYGWFSVLAKPILWLMTTLRSVIPNWGLVIIALTFIIKLLLHPVNKKSFTSMKAMQQLQPKLAEIKEKYPDDREKQNVEVMQLFRTHKVNPAAGCLPMLLQMPVYIVLYKVLWNAIELYHAPFVGPYKDLSAPDPYFILPILLGIFMALQQKLTPNASADPAQQKMMMIMPLLFTTFMFFLPVGLVVYIFVNTFVSVLQQFMMTRDLSFKDLITGKWQAKNA